MNGQVVITPAGGRPDANEEAIVDADRPTSGDRRLWMSMARLVSHLARGASHAVERAEGINLSQMTLLAQVRALGGSVRMVDLARRLQLTKPAITKIVGALEEAGHVTRMRDEADGRVIRVGLTASGRRALGRAGAEFEAVMTERFWRHLDPGESERVAELLEGVVDALGLGDSTAMPPS